NFEVGGPDGNSLYENCGTGNLIFTRPESFDSDNSFVAYLSYNGSATMGVDYTELPDSIVFDPGIESVEIPIDAFTDGLTEGTENVHMTITNLAQCSEVMLESEFEFFINDEAEPLVVDGYEEHICAGGTVELIPIISGGYANYGYQWSTGESTETISVSPPGDMIYNVIVTDTCGMPSDDADISIIVGFPPIGLTVSPDPIEVGCGGLNLTGEATGGDGSYTWTWLDGNGNNMWGWQNSLWLSTWNFTDEITVSIVDGCGETGEVTVYPTSTFVPMVVNLETNVIVGCPGNYTVTPEITGGTEPFFYSWYDAAWNYVGSSSTYTINITGSTFMNFSVSDNCGNYYSATINFSIEPVELVVSLPQGLTGSCTDLFTIQPEITGGGGTFTYEWTQGGDVIGNDETLQFVSNETTDIQITVNDNCGGTGTASTTITIISVPPVLTLSEDQTATCVETRTFTATAMDGEPAYSFLWSAEGTQIAAGNTADYQAFESTEITCIVTDACGLTDEETVMLNIYNPPINIEIIPDSSICQGDEINLTTEVTGGAGTLSYFWPTVLDESENTLDHVLVSPGISQEYNVIVMDECGQEETTEVDIEVQFVEADFTVEYLNDSEVMLEALSADSCLDCTYYWNFGDGLSFVGDSVIHEYDGLDQYQVALLVTNALGCYRTDYQVVYPPVQLYIPNTFTPDGDGINDVWLFEANGVMTFELKIFNRWGDVIFSSTNPNVAWTGDVHDGEYYAQDAVYSWYIEYTGVDGDAKSRSGSVNVLR
ncbi:MAG: gliding motility-associated C-terminal domain-containing protein, partial [Flavobacteriales bacterium]